MSSKPLLRRQKAESKIQKAEGKGQKKAFKIFVFCLLPTAYDLLFVLCLLLSAFCFLHFPGVVYAAEKAEIHLGPQDGKTDEKGIPQGWKELTFRKIPKHTKYAVVNNDGHWLIKAESRDSASALVKELDLDPKKYQFLKWRWKIKSILPRADETTKEGDDYAARIYVTYKYIPEQATIKERALYALGKMIYGKTPPKASLNYTWANKVPQEHAIFSPYSEKVKLIAVESGPALAGQWREEERNIYEDYKKQFGEEPPPISGIAIMTDSDNTHGEAEAYYGEIILRAKE